MASVSDGMSLAPQKHHLTILDLPQETQKDIIGHGDLICLSLVSKHFRDLAAAQLYRNFHIIFPDEDDPAFDVPIDGLAGGLETFVTSDYNYGKHLKDLSLDTLSAGAKAELAYKPYLYSVSCGKFMNTLLLLTLRKAKTLETFRWNIRVELSRPVYQALHRIETLSNVHIRLQSGPSLYETPPPLPFTSSAAAAAPIASSSHLPDVAPTSLPLPGFTMPLAPPSVFYAPAPATAPPPPLPKPPARPKAPKKTSMAKEPPTLSAFQKLKSLSVLDVDSLEVVTEIKSCVRNSSGTLTKLKLSFSETLAAQARKPPPDADPEDSDPDDEFQVVPGQSNPSHVFHEEGTGPAKAYRAQEERRSQEAVLGRIFDVEPYLVKKHKKRPADKDKDKEAKESPSPGREFITAIRAVSNKLMKNLNASGDFIQQQMEALDIIEAAARKYVTSEEAKDKGDDATEGLPAEKKAAGAQNGQAGSSSSSGSQKAGGGTELAEPQAAEGGLFAPKASGAKEAAKVEQDVRPEDINIEEPEGQLFIESPESVDTNEDRPGDLTPSESSAEEKPSSSQAQAPRRANGKTVPPSVGKAMTNLAAQKDNFKLLTDKLHSFEVQANKLSGEILHLHNADGVLDLSRITDAEKQMTRFTRNIVDIQREMHIVEAEIADAERQIPLALGDLHGESEAGRRRISDYVRSTRGLALKTLSIYLIPTKASVLSKAVELRVLQSITLLNVGPQAPIWALLSKENKVEPLPLRKIFTDNVSMAFLNFLSAINGLQELYLLERDAKYKPESFAPRTTITTEQIRHFALRKHLPTLRRLMIKNMNSNEWDMDEKTMGLLSMAGGLLEELAVSMNIKAIHTLMQRISGFGNLRALHIIQLRNDDTCVWVMRETKRFLMDSISHYPELKLEWLSIDDDTCVERVIWTCPGPKPPKAKSAKGKGKEKATIEPTVEPTAVPTVDPTSETEPFPLLSMDAWETAADSDDDLVEDEKVTLGNASHFSDVWGVKIFKKEIMSGRL